jgi:hypothetical protein
MRTVSIVLATALVTAALTIFGMKAIGSSPTLEKFAAKASTTVDVMKMMRGAKDLPIESYQAH